MSKYKISGIYEIYNNETNDCYIGSSIDVYGRFEAHRCMLCKGHHHNIFLQNDWEKYGQSSFTFKVVEIISDRSILAKREQFYMDQLNPKYNNRPIAQTCVHKKRHCKWDERQYY